MRVTRAWGKPIALLLLSGGLGLVLPGCGGESVKVVPQRPAQQPYLGDRSYELRMQRLGSEVGGSIQRIGNLMVVNRSVVSKPRVIRELRRLQVVLRSAAAKLAKITPPPKIRAQHELLTRGVREYAKELTGVIAAVRAGDSARALSVIPTLAGIRQMTAASQAIRNAGFNIGT